MKTLYYASIGALVLVAILLMLVKADTVAAQQDLISAHQEAARAQQEAAQDTIKENERWRKWSQDGRARFDKDIAERPYERGTIEPKWQAEYNKEWGEHQKRLADINRRLQEKLQRR